MSSSNILSVFTFLPFFCLFIFELSYKIQTLVLIGEAQWVGYSVNWKVTGSIPGQGTCLGCGPDPWLGVWERQPMDWCFCSTSIFLSLSFPSHFSKKKWNIYLKKKIQTPLAVEKFFKYLLICCLPFHLNSFPCNFFVDKSKIFVL